MTDSVSKHKAARPPVEYTKHKRRTIPCPNCKGVMDRGAKQCMECLTRRPEIIQPSDPSKRAIALTKGYIVTVNASDYERLACDLWCAKIASDGKVYAQRGAYVNGKYKMIKMHRFIMGVSDPKIEVDHKNPKDTLNNCRDNLRLATRAQNASNGLKKRGHSKYKGVTFRGKRPREFSHFDSWRAQVCVNGKRIFLGTFRIDDNDPSKAEESAARAYDAGAIKYFGEFAYLNFPEDHYQSPPQPLLPLP